MNEPADAITNAPRTVTIAGAEATLEARVWRNLMPGSGMAKGTVRLLARLHLAGPATGPGVSIAAIWLVPTGEKPIPATGLSSTSYEGGARTTGAAPYAGASKTFTLVARLRAPDGSIALLRSAELRLQAVR